VSTQTSPAFRWLERGRGAPVVLLHGLMGHMHDWEPVLDALGEASCAIAPELPIVDPALVDVSVAGLARWVLGGLDALGLERVTLGGNSLGGHVAATVALMAPHRVSALILAGSSGLLERGFRRRVPHRPGEAFIRARMEEIFFDPALVTPEAVAAVARSLREPSTARRLVRIARSARRDGLEPRLGAIAAPTLLLWGREDRITPLAMAHRFRVSIPGSTLVVLRRCGHAPMIERPGAFAAVTLAWLDALRAAGLAALETELAGG
jgi:2-hydroxy-6-oxonona-2,4-dienedioate hydrolase